MWRSVLLVVATCAIMSSATTEEGPSCSSCIQIVPTIKVDGLAKVEKHGTVVEAVESCCHIDPCKPCCNGGHGGCWVKPHEVAKGQVGSQAVQAVPVGKLGSPVVHEKWGMRVVPKGEIGKAPHGDTPAPDRSVSGIDLVKKITRARKLAKRFGKAHDFAKDVAQTANMKDLMPKSDIDLLTAAVKQPLSKPVKWKPHKLTRDEKHNMQIARDNIDKCIILRREERRRTRKSLKRCHQSKGDNAAKKKCADAVKKTKEAWEDKYSKDCEGAHAAKWWKAARYTCDKLRAGLVHHADTYKKRCRQMSNHKEKMKCFTRYRDVTDRWYNRMEMACKNDKEFNYLHLVAKSELPSSHPSLPMGHRSTVAVPPADFHHQFCIPKGVTIPNYVFQLPGVGPTVKALKPCPDGVQACIPKQYQAMKDQIPSAMVPHSLKGLLSSPPCPEPKAP